MVLTDRGQSQAAGRSLPETVAAAVEGGARTVLLREKDLPRPERQRVAKELVEMLATVDGELIVASDVELARAVDAAGVHLAASDPLPRTISKTVRGRSCHSVEELRAARAEGVDYATLSPIWPTDSKPGYGPAPGVEGLAQGCAAVPDLPVYALGGVGPGRVEVCRQAGVAGVAVMGKVMRADDPAKVMRTLLQEWS
jgi:thiamine-phosphate pyrophosphorylase